MNEFNRLELTRELVKRKDRMKYRKEMGQDTQEVFQHVLLGAWKAMKQRSQEPLLKS